MERDPYFGRPEVSNSDLKWLGDLLNPKEEHFDKQKAFANGTLIDAMITEPDKVDYFKLKVQGEPYQFSQEEFDRAKEMKKAFYRDQFCANMVKQCSFQKVSICPEFNIEHDGVKFALPARCKWDLFVEAFDLSGDIKSTTATTQKQAEEAVRYFDYDQSRAWYMDLESARSGKIRSNDILIFISKENFKVFKIPVKRDGQIYKDGKSKYQELAFKYWSLFGGIKQVV